jgi:hypothetical protein
MYKLFLADFGVCNASYTSNEAIYVLANDYNEAAQKALDYDTNKPRKVIDNDGSLMVEKPERVLNTIRLISTNVII